MNRQRPADDAEARFARLLSVVRHELLTPLSVIKGFADVLARQDDRAEVAAIQRNAHLATLLLDRLRDADDIIEGRDLELEVEEVDVTALVRDTLADVDDTLLSEHTVEFDVPEDPVTAWVDVARIRQVLFNLLSNAAKYSDPGTTVVVDVRRVDGITEIAITNEGEGIAPDDVERAFEAFSRLSEDGRGTGLGLAISRAIARALGGDLTSRPAPEGEGSRFVVTLPAAPAPEADGRRRHAHGSSARTAPR